MNANFIKYNSLVEVYMSVKSGKTVNWQNGNYYVKIDFDGDLVIKPSSGYGGEILTEKHLPDLFTNTNI